jgi:hypothetical protein
MKDRKMNPEITNVFEVALHEAFRKLQIGEPNKKIRKAIDKATKKITSEVKDYMKDLRKKEEKRVKDELKKLRKSKAKKGKNGVTNRQPAQRNTDHEIVQNIVA